MYHERFLLNVTMTCLKRRIFTRRVWILMTLWKAASEKGNCEDENIWENHKKASLTSFFCVALTFLWICQNAYRQTKVEIQTLWHHLKAIKVHDDDTEIIKSHKVDLRQEDFNNEIYFFSVVRLLSLSLFFQCKNSFFRIKLLNMKEQNPSNLIKQNHCEPEKILQADSSVC